MFIKGQDQKDSPWYLCEISLWIKNLKRNKTIKRVRLIKCQI